jgi:hypothetical protein
MNKLEAGSFLVRGAGLGGRESMTLCICFIGFGEDMLGGVSQTGEVGTFFGTAHGRRVTMTELAHGF